MSQIQMDTQNLSHYESNLLEKPNGQPKTSDVLVNAQPMPKTSSSAWKLGGRIAIGILTGGISELVYLAWQGIKSLVANAKPSPQQAAPRVQGSKGLPKAAPDADKNNTVLKAMLKKGSTVDASPEYRQAMETALSDLRIQYGEKYIPQGTSLNDVLSKFDKMALVHLHMLIGKANHALSPREFYTTVKKFTQEKLNIAILEKNVENAAKQVGGLGGIKPDYLAEKLLEQSGQKNVNKLKTLDNPADVDKLCDKINIKKSVSEIKEGINDLIQELCDTFGADKLPASLDEIMKLKTDDDSFIYEKINNSMLSKKDDFVANKNSIKKEIKKHVLPSIVSKNINDILTTEFASQKTVPSKYLIENMTKDILKMHNNSFINSKNAQDFSKALSGIDVKGLIATQKETANSLYEQYQSQVQMEVRPLLKDFINGLSFLPVSAQKSKNKVAELVNSMKNWKNVQGTGEEFKNINNQLGKEFANDLSTNKLANEPGKETEWKGNIFITLLADAGRAIYIVNGEHIHKTEDKEAAPLLTQALENALPNPIDQQMISKIANQSLCANFSTVMGTGGFTLSGADLSAAPDVKYLPVLDHNTQLLGQSSLGAEYNIAVSDDKKTATLVGTVYYTMNYPGTSGISMDKPHFGAYKNTYTIEFNLSANEKGPGVTNLTIGQEFIPFEQEKQLLNARA